MGNPLLWSTNGEPLLKKQRIALSMQSVTNGTKILRFSISAEIRVLEEKPNSHIIGNRTKKQSLTWTTENAPELT